MTDQILDAPILVVGDGTVLRDAAVAVVGTTIAMVGPADEVRSAHPNLPVRSFAHHLLMPGLVNAHTHLPMTLLRGYAEGLDLQGFLERVMSAEGSFMDPETVALGAELGAVECLLGGVTTALDMYFHPAAGHAAASRTGLRHLGGPIFFDSPIVDGLEWDQRLELAMVWPANPDQPTVLMPHGTYTVPPERMREVAAVATELDALVHIHASENLAENADVAVRHGATPVGVLEETGVLESRTVIGHGVHLSDDDVELLARRGAAVAHCPVSNLKLASGMADVRRLLDAGIRVSLGTDGCSSSNDLDMWVAMRTAALVASAITGRPAALEPWEVVHMATAGGAAALGLEDRIGMIAPGLEADLILLDLDRPHLTPIHDVHALLVYSACKADVSDVFVRGQHVVAAGEPVNTDLPDLLERARRRAEQAPKH